MYGFVYSYIWQHWKVKIWLGHSRISLFVCCEARGRITSFFPIIDMPVRQHWKLIPINPYSCSSLFIALHNRGRNHNILSLLSICAVIEYTFLSAIPSRLILSFLLWVLEVQSHTNTTCSLIQSFQEHTLVTVPYLKILVQSKNISWNHPFVSCNAGIWQLHHLTRILFSHTN